MMITKEEKTFIIQNREVILGILAKYLDFYKTLIWKEKDLAKKVENSAVADRLDDAMITIKNLKLNDTPKQGNYTGV